MPQIKRVVGEIVERLVQKIAESDRVSAVADLNPREIGERVAHPREHRQREQDDADQHGGDDEDRAGSMRQIHADYSLIRSQSTRTPNER